MELTPDIEMPMLIVMATYPGADPESVDELVASVIEDSGSTLSGVDSVNSYSFENYCMVLFTYEYGVDIDECHNEISEQAMETAKLSLPDDVDQPTIIEMNMNSMDVMTISAVEVGDVDMLKVVNESVVPELESLSSVAQVSVTGGSEDYIKVELNETLMKQYGLTMSSVAQMLGTVDFTYPAGSVTQGSQDISVATSMEYNTVQKLREVPLMTTKGQVITLQDIANVTTASKDASSISRYNGQDNVSIGIKNKSSAGTVNACRDVKEKLQQIQAENPAIEFEVTYDASSSIISSLTSVAETLLLGVVLTMAVLFLFFGDFKQPDRRSLHAHFPVPDSDPYEHDGFSMNIVTLGSLVIAIGMMVDSSIVVIESCFRRQKSTPDLKQTALEGTKEVTASIIASTITTIVVYLPLATMKGLSGQMFEQLGFTIVFAMLASLIAAMMLVPLFYTVFKPKEKENLPIDKLLKKFTTWYQRILRKLMKRRRTVVGVAVALMIGTVLLAGTLDMELIPAADEGVVAVTVNFRSGTTLEKEDEALKLWEQIAEEEPDVEFYSVSISGSSATLTADLIKKRTLTTAQVVDKWNEIAAGMTDMDVTVTSSGSSMSSMMSTSSYEIDLQGSDRAELAQAAEDLQAEIEKIDGVVKTENSLANSTTLAQGSGRSSEGNAVRADTHSGRHDHT